MKSWSRFALILFAYGIALLHTVVPHHHAQARTGESVISHTACIFSESSGGLLQKVLSTDLGIGHLETFKAGDADVEIPTSFIAAAAVLLLSINILTSAPAVRDFSNDYIEKLKRKLLLFSVSHLRAPPAH